MFGKKFRPFVIPSIYVLLVVLFALFGILLNESLKVVENKDENNLTYVSYEVLFDYAIPTINEENNTIIRPYNDENVTIGKYYYDLNDEKTQENAIIYYENTYMQNNGVDYSNDEEFDVVSILDGEVISIEDNAIYGKVVTIKHNDNLKSVYSNVKNVLVNVGYKISQGEIFASSDTYKVDTKVKSLLHFEVYYKDNAIDPENLYTMSVSDLK